MSTSVDGGTLRWTQPSWKQKRYELKKGDELVATLDYRGKWKTLPTLILDGEELVFKGKGFFKTSVGVMRDSVEIATYSPKSFRSEIRFINGRTFYWQRKGIWSSVFVITAPDNEEIMRFKYAARWFRTEATISPSRGASNYPELRVLYGIGLWIMLVAAASHAA